MKRLLSLVLAAAMILSMFAMTVSAADIAFPVSFVWRAGFMLDEDGVLDIDTDVTEVPYGGTIYFPLLNTNANTYDDDTAETARLKAAYEQAETDYNTAKSAYDSAKNAYDNAVSSALTDKEAADAAVATATTNKANAQSAVDAAQEALNNAESGTNTALVDAFDEVIGLVGTLNVNKQTKSAREADIDNLEIDLANWTGRLNTITGYITGDAYLTQLQEYYDGNKSAVPSAYTDLEFVKTYIGDSLSASIVIPEIANYDDADEVAESFLAALTSAKSQLETKIGASSGDDSQPSTAGVNINQWIRYYTKVVADLSSSISSSESTINSKCDAIESTYSVSIPSGDRFDVDALETIRDANSAIDNSALQQALTNAQNALTEATTALTNAQNTLTEKTTAYNNAVDNTSDLDTKKADRDAKEAAKNTAYSAWQNSILSADAGYVFVYESAAVSNAKVKADWDYGSKYVDKIELDRVQAKSSAFGLGTTYTGSKAKIYCIAVTLEESSSTDEAEVEGEIAISKSGSNGYSLADTAADISLTICAPSAEPDAEITAKPQLFEEDYSFDAEEDHIFYFEEDDSSYFEVNTKNQKDIVLAFDTDWDDDIADEIYEKNPNADLDFYNGNYAKFSKTGTLWLGYDEDDADDAYVYAISTSGKLSLVNADYDEYEEAFEIRTNTLGRYVISTEKLKLSSTSSSSGSGTGTGTGTVTSSKSSTATVASSSKPASSTPVSSSKPASSTPAASSSQISSQESSKESKPSSEPLSIKEPSSEEDNKHVSGTTEPKDEDVPTKKGGVSWIVWLLILAGLVAVVVAVGVIFYTKKNSGRRML